MQDSATTADERDGAILDLAHLDRQTLGDPMLRREVLTLFVDHAARTMAALRGTEDLRLRREAAHALIGAARGIGAFGVARRAREIEADPGAAETIAALGEAVTAVRRAIADHLSD